MMTMTRVLLLALVVASAGCAPGVKSSRHLRPDALAPAEQWRGVGRLVVLPPDNWTPDVGYEYITWYRAVVHDLLREKGYEVRPLAEVNRFMRDNKFNVPGEATMYTPAELCRRLSADAVLYWDITGVGESPKLNLSLLKADGTVLWATGETALVLTYNAVAKGGYAPSDHRLALALGEILRRIPNRS